MSPRFRCSTCNSTYSDTQPDGTLYFHRCPPVPNPAFQPDPTKPAVDLRETVERANFRDENLKAGLTIAEGRYVTLVPVPDDPNITREVPVADPLRAEGAGRTQIP